MAHRDDVHPAQGQPRQDPHRPGGDRRRQDRARATSWRARVPRTSPRSTAASSSRCSARWASTATPARCCGCRPAARSRPDSCSSSGSATATPSPLERVRRAAGVAARNVGNAASVALALPAHDADARPRRRRRLPARAATPSSATSRARTTPGVAEVSVLSDAARRQDAIAALEAAQTVADVVNRARDWVNTPPNDLTPELFADGVLALGKERAGPLEAEGRHRGPRPRRAGRARLRRHPRRRPRLGQPAPAGQADLGAGGRAGQGRVRRQGHHLRLRRPDHQARQLDGDDEVRHGRCRRRDRRDLRHRRARAPGGRHDLRADGREHGLRHRRCAPATCSRCSTARPSRSPTPTPRAG